MAIWLQQFKLDAIPGTFATKAGLMVELGGRPRGHSCVAQTPTSVLTCRERHFGEVQCADRKDLPSIRCVPKLGGRHSPIRR